MTDRPKLGRNVIALAAVSFLTDVSSEMIYPLLPVFLTTVLGANASFIGAIEGAAETTAALLKLASGWWSDRIRRRKPLVLAGALATAAALGLLAALGKPEPSTLAIWLTVFGFLPAFLPVLIAHGRSFLPPHLVGRGMTLFNIGTMGGTFVVQLASGALIDLFPAHAGVYPLDAYRLVFAVQAVAIMVASAAYLTVRR